MITSFEQAGELNHDMLFAGPAETLSVRNVMVEEGQTLPRGAVLGRVAASGHYRLCAALDGNNQPIEDGSQTPDVILALPVDATSTAKEALAFVRGDFAVQALTLGLGHTAESIADPLRDRGIILVSIVE